MLRIGSEYCEGIKTRLRGGFCSFFTKTTYYGGNDVKNKKIYWVNVVKPGRGTGSGYGWGVSERGGGVEAEPI